MGAALFEEQRIVLAEGGGFNETWTLKDKVSGAVIVITGDTLTAHVRAEYDVDLTNLATISPTVTDGAAGEFTWDIAEDNASILALASGRYVYDLFRQPSGGTRRKIAQGAFIKTDSATKF